VDFNYNPNQMSGNQGASPMGPLGGRGALSPQGPGAGNGALGGNPRQQ